MNKFRIVFLVAMLFFSKAYAQDLTITDHTKLFYKFTEFDKSVTYSFSFESITPKISYECGNSNKEENNGTGIITEDAINNAINLFFFYSDSGIVTFYDRTPSFIVSKKIYNELKTTGKSRIRLQDNENTNTLDFIRTEDFEIALNKDILKKEIKNVKVLHARFSGDSGYEIWILDNPEFPIVIKLHAQKDYELKEVK